MFHAALGLYILSTAAGNGHVKMTSYFSIISAFLEKICVLVGYV